MMPLITTIEKYGIILRLVDNTDAEFILSLRTDQKLSTHLSATSPALSDQLSWITRYKEREKLGLEYYFMALDADGNRLGTTRIYNLEPGCFETGSWIFSRSAPHGAAIKADIIGREFAFDRLGLEFCKFEVRKGNAKVLKYHRAYHPEVIAEDELNYYFQLGKAAFVKHSQKLIKLLS